MPTRYADDINKQFNETESHYFSLTERIDSAVDNATWRRTTIDEAVADFKRRNPTIKAWSDIDMCEPGKTVLSKILIDSTLQRLLDLYHVNGIVSSFKALRVMPINVYENPDLPGQYICWDGQHTGVALAIVAANALGLELDQCEVPINIYQSHQKSEIRGNFIGLNGEDKKPLDEIDIFQQMVFGVRTDGNDNPVWVLAERKQQALEKWHLFATHEKFDDAEEPGALTRMSELMDRKYSLAVTQHFCEYFYCVCNSSRPVQPKEAWLLYDFFKACEDQNIKVTSAYIKAVARSLQVVGRDDFENDFDAIEFAHQAKLVHEKRFRENSPDRSLTGIKRPERPVVYTLFIKQIRKGIGNRPVPEYTPYYVVKPEDLF